MSKSNTILFGSLLMLSLMTQSCSNLRFYSSIPSTPSTNKEVATKKEEVKKEETKRTNSSYGIDKDEKLRVEIVAYAKQFIGTNYKYGGTTPRGFDCSGFTSHVMDEFNINLRRTSGEQAKQGKKISLKQSKSGDLVFFSKNGRIFHVAMVAENKNGKIKIIHSTSSRGVVIDQLSGSKYWVPKIHSVRNVSQIN